MSSYLNKIELKDINKFYDNMHILKEISINVKEGELVSVLGPSGSGKSTIFNIISKLTNIDSGNIEINGNVSYMYQKDMMVPWKNIIDNIAIPLVLKGNSKKEGRKVVEGYMETFGLKGFERSYPIELSGGMKQRANFLKTYLTSNDIMLLDEPFGALDSITRGKMQEWLLKITKEVKSTILFITHDIEEAIFLSDRIYVISDKPASIIGEFEVNLPKERNKESIVSKEFIELKKKIINVLDK